MDIVRTKSKNKKNQRILSILSILLFIALPIFFIFDDNKGTFIVSKNTLLIDQVKRGELNISVRGTGILVPKDIRWVATDVQGRVDRIFVKPGSQVKTGDLLLELSNPQLVQNLEETKWKIEEVTAELNAQHVSSEADLLDQEAAVINEKLNYERALLTLNAQKKLLQQGLVTVSHIQHEEVKIDVAQFKERWQLELKRLDKRKETVKAQRKAFQARLSRMHRTLKRAQDQFDGLKVRATMDSIVQVMSVELGQQVNSGTNLARLAKNGDFIAELRIPEKQIKDVALGQAVIIDTRISKITGKVKRIDPAVINGSVEIDVELTSNIPQEARPELTVDGEIKIAQFTDTLFVKRPMLASSFAQTTVYRLDETGESAKAQKVTFGMVSTKYIQIQSGLNSGENIIVSDVSTWKNHQQIRLN